MRRSCTFSVTHVSPESSPSFALADFDLAYENNAQILFSKNDTSTTVAVASSGSFGAGGTCFGANGNGESFSSLTKTFQACELYDGSDVFDATIAISAPSAAMSFSYTIGAETSFDTVLTSNVDVFHHTVAKGPSDPALYPMVVRIQPTNVEFPNDVVMKAVPQRGLGCGLLNAVTYQQDYNFPRCTASYQSSSWTPCEIVLACPSEALGIGIEDYETVASKFNVAYIRTGQKESIDITQQSTTLYRTVNASSALTIAMTIPEFETYSVVVQASRKFETNSLPRYINGDCATNSQASLTGRTINEKSSRIQISSSGMLVLTGAGLQTEFIITIGPLISDCSSSAVLPPICDGRLTEPVYLPTYSFSQSDDIVRQLNATYASIAPADFAANNACYQAFLDEICRANIPRCSSEALFTADICARDCLARYAARGCPASVGSERCRNERLCVPPALSPMPQAEPILAPATVRPPRAAPKAAPPRAVPQAPPKASPVGPPTSVPPSSPPTNTPQAAPVAVSSPSAVPVPTDSPVASSAPVDPTAPVSTQVSVAADRSGSRLPSIALFGLAVLAGLLFVQ